MEGRRHQHSHLLWSQLEAEEEANLEPLRWRLQGQNSYLTVNSSGGKVHIFDIIFARYQLAETAAVTGHMAHRYSFRRQWLGFLKEIIEER